MSAKAVDRPSQLTIQNQEKAHRSGPKMEGARARAGNRTAQLAHLRSKRARMAPALPETAWSRQGNRLPLDDLPYGSVSHVPRRGNLSSSGRERQMRKLIFWVMLAVGFAASTQAWSCVSIIDQKRGDNCNSVTGSMFIETTSCSYRSKVCTGHHHSRSGFHSTISASPPIAIVPCAVGGHTTSRDWSTSLQRND